jgi:hypothetical protein
LSTKKGLEEGSTLQDSNCALAVVNTAEDSQLQLLLTQKQRVEGSTLPESNRGWAVVITSAES